MTKRSYLVAGALVMAASGLLPLAGPGDAHARELGNARGAQGLDMEGVVDASGNIRVPENYRHNYQYLGSWAVAADQGSGSKDLHVVFASPGTAEVYRKTGSFPDGAILVKEVFEAATAPMTTGIVSHAGTLKGWFVMVRDTAGRHADNELWGDGWGWSWFDAGNPSKTTSVNYKTDCRGCHVPAQGTEWVYVAGYPVLRP